MKLNLKHFLGDYEELGVDIAGIHGDEILSIARHLPPNKQTLSIDMQLLPVIRGISDSLSMDNVVVGACLESIKYNVKSEIFRIGDRYLYAAYEGSGTSIDVLYGELEGDPFFAASLSPQMPGSLLGMGKGGIAYARKAPKNFRVEDASIFLIHDLYPDEYPRLNALSIALPFDLYTAARYPALPMRHIPSIPVPYIDAREYAKNKFMEKGGKDAICFFMNTKTLEVTMFRNDGTDVTIDMMMSVSQ